MPSSISVSEIRRRARWYVNVRWFYVLGIGVPGILSLLGAYGYSPQVQEDILFVAGILAINGLFLGTTYIWQTKSRLQRAFVVSQIIFDLTVMSATFYLNRGSESPLPMLYAIPIVMTAAFFGRQAIYSTGLAAVLCFVTLSFLDYTRILPVLHIAAPQLHTDPQLFYPPLVTVVAIMAALTIITDLVGRLISEREQLMIEVRALSAHSAEIDAILRTMGSALVAVDRAGIIILANDSFEKLTGWKRAEVIGKPLEDILPLYDAHGKRVPAAHRPMLQYLIDNNAAPALEPRWLSGYSYMRKQGTMFTFVGSVAPISLNGALIGFTTVFDDATDIKKLDQLKDNFIALISHQLKTPIGEINGYAYNLLGGVAGQLNPTLTSYAESIQEQAARAGKLIADLLDIVLAGEGNLTVQNEPVDLKPVLEQIMKLRQAQAAKKHIQLVTEPIDKMVYVRGDAAKLMQALGNFVDNAIRYTKAGAVTVSVVLTDKQVEVHISDSGDGMDESTQNALFGDREQIGPLIKAPTAGGSSGLGIYLAKQLIALMNGTIRLVSSSGQGTTIAVGLQRVEQEHSRPKRYQHNKVIKGAT